MRLLQFNVYNCNTFDFLKPIFYWFSLFWVSTLLKNNTL